MKFISNAAKSILRAAIFIVCTTNGVTRAAQSNSAPLPAEIRIAEAQGRVEILQSTSANWSTAQTSQILQSHDQIRTGADSRVALRWSDQSIVAFGASTELEILPPNSSADQAGLHLIRGVISFFHRDQPGHIQVITRGTVAGVEGTEFLLAVDDADATTLSVVDGQVRFGNTNSFLLLTNGQQAVAKLGKNPARTAGFTANNLLQWCFYYPAVIDPDELQLAADEQKDLSGSLENYRDGDLPAALKNYPAGRANISGREKIFHAALLLSVGEVENSETILSSIPDHSARTKNLSDSLRQLIAAVKKQPSVAGAPPQLASEFLAASYFEQSRAVRETSLENALRLAKKAAAISPNFGFARERVAELEFSFGDTKNALKDLDASLKLSPRNAQALALKGFILSAQNEPKLARGWFGRALAADAALGNAWLGRGLCKIRLGDNSGGREDLLVAAALEPQRSELRSYLGKAYAHTGDDAHAAKEFLLAKKLDANDPTPFLYSALLNQQSSQINDAIRDLEKSESLNDNRSVYRSQLLLDDDRAVRSADLAGIYRDDGMFDLSVREAGRAVDADYANYSAHLFLANSYEQMRDPNWSNLRYEAPATSEYWIANLLAPANAGWLSAIASEQPYAKLFDQNRVGVVSDTTYLDRGAWTEAGAQFGTFDNFSYSLEAKYISDPGQRVNEDLDHRDLQLSLKYQLTPQDNFFASIEQDEISSGDVNEYYNQSSASTAARFDEKQSPNIFLGYHHEWSPGAQTLFFAARQSMVDDFFDPNDGHWVGWLNGGEFANVDLLSDHNQTTVSTAEYSAELQQLLQSPDHTTVLGARYLWGETRFQNREWSPSSAIGSLFAGDLGSLNPDPNYPFEIANQNLTDDFHHASVYAYHDWRMFDSFKVSSGLSYDYLERPAVADAAPYSSEEQTRSQVSPKAGFIWTPFENTVARFAYARSLSGFLNDSSVRIEPTEIAGFNQAYRSVIPDSVAGDTSGSRIDTFDGLLEQKFSKGTYLSLAGEFLDSKLLKQQAAYIYHAAAPAKNYPIFPGGLCDRLGYRETSVTLAADQLLGKQWAIGAKYRWTQAGLNSSYVDINPANLAASGSPFQARQNLESVLQTVALHANWNHPSGLFSILEADWYHQDNSGFSASEPGDDFWQFNLCGGCRFWRRKAEFTVGVLNLAGQNYRLEPLNLLNELARGRTFYTRLKVSF